VTNRIDPSWTLAGQTRAAWGWARSAPAAARRLRRSSLARSSGIYVVSNILNSVVPFALLPILTRVLSPAEYGLAAMFLLGVSLFEPLVGVSTSSAVSRRYFDREELDFPAYVTSTLMILLLSVALVSLAVAIFNAPLSDALAVPGAWLFVAVGLAAARFLVSLVLVIWQAQHRAVPYAILSFLQTLGIFGISIALIIWWNMGWRGRALGETIAMTVAAIVAISFLWKAHLLRHPPTRAYAKDALRFGGGLVPHLYGAVLIAATDRFLIAHMVGIDAAGLFIVGAQIALGISVLERSFNLAWAPWLFGRLKAGRPEDHRLIRRFTLSYNVIIVILALLLAAAAPVILGFLVGPRFRGSAPFVLWLALAAAFAGMYKMVVNSIFFHNKTYLLSWVTFGVGAINVPVAYALIRLNGALGAAQATAIASLLSYIATLLLARRVERSVQESL
jgi:O-antigen/teichoic acid export membrane protein